MKYVIDTNIINWLIDDRIDRTRLPADGEFVATHIQIDEINRTSDADRRARLILALTSTIRELLPTETTILEVSRLDWCKLGDGVLYTSVKNELDAENGGRRGNIQDALIAEVAVMNGFTLLTADTDLAEVTKHHNGMVHTLQ
jgi:predicted nucleic acid-binding protein